MQVSDSSSRILAGLLEARTGQQLTMSRRWRIETALSVLLRERGIPTLDELMERLEIDGPAVAISAEQRTGFDALRNAIGVAIDEERGMRTVQIRIPYDRSELVERFYRTASVDSVEHDEAGTVLTGRISARHLDPYRDFLIREEPAVLPAAATSGTRESAA